MTPLWAEIQTTTDDGDPITVKRSDLEHIKQQVQGGNSDAPNGHNLAGAINALLNTYDDAQEWGATPTDTDWDEAHEDFQYILRDLSNQLADLVGTDDTLDADDGTKLTDLPYAATTGSTSRNLPDPPTK